MAKIVPIVKLAASKPIAPPKAKPVLQPAHVPTKAKPTAAPPRPSNIVALPKRRSPKELARAYMMGELLEQEYPARGGLRQRFLAADKGEGMAQDAALKAIEKLAELEADLDPNKTIDVKLVAIENIDGKIVEANSA